MDRIRTLLNEDAQAALTRQEVAFAVKRGSSARPVVLFGAGMLGRKVLRAFRARGQNVVAFVDNNLALEGGDVDGVPVLSPEAGAARWGRTALFVVTIWRSHGDAGMSTRMEFLRTLGCLSVTSFIELSWSLPGVLPHFGIAPPSELLAHSPEIIRVGSLWADEASRRCYQEQLFWRLTGDFSGVSRPDAAQYFPPEIILPHSREEFVDGGAFDGDTLRSIPWGVASAWAFEPDPASADALSRGAPQNTRVIRAALGERAGMTNFDATGGLGSARSASGAICVPVVSIDDLLGGESPTFIKLDVEGDEFSALIGARRTLLRSRPVVAVCLYHKPDDLWRIPLFLHQLLPLHRLFLRSHANDGFELVGYAVPPHRCVSSH